MNRIEQSAVSRHRRERAEEICRKMEELSGFNPTAETRKRGVVTCRVMVSYVLLLEGWTEHQVGCVLGWDHSTINHYRRKFEDMMTQPGYEYERELWNKFKQAI